MTDLEKAMERCEQRIFVKLDECVDKVVGRTIKAFDEYHEVFMKNADETKGNLNKLSDTISDFRKDIEKATGELK